MVEGVWELMPSAEVWHIGLYRDERTLKPVSYYNRLPVEPTVSVCFILDPMLATGQKGKQWISLKNGALRKLSSWVFWLLRKELKPCTFSTSGCANPYCQDR